MGEPIRVEAGDFAVRLTPGSNATCIADRHGFLCIGQIGELVNHYIFRPHDASQDPLQLEKFLVTLPEVEYVERQVKTPRSKRG
ncbi:hypothetical protein SpCBS45565_g08127 [Spizellomyces sp. 'palustris']|nr:hypothetical protein SpCBS45565_g08127 [Spizellomyces sp. 'palustris']